MLQRCNAKLALDAVMLMGDGALKRVHGEDDLQKQSGRPRLRTLICAIFAGTIASAAALAGPLALDSRSPGSSGGSPVQLAHGFHCRPMVGWDPRFGVYRLHRHPGICRDQPRCLRVMYRCNLIMGRGWEAWSYERWGFDNWRFDKCMLDEGCY